MSADELRKAAERLRERAGAATPGEWIPFGGSMGVTVKGCTCAGTAPGYPQHEQYCGIDGPVIQADETDIAYIATVHPGVGLALADLLETLAGDYEQYDVDGRTWDHRIVPLARLINGGAA